MKNQNTKILAESALMLALATILSFIKIYQLPYGGTITLCSMVPIIYIALVHPVKWGILTSFCYSLIQMLASFYSPPTKDFISYLLVVLLDYVIAFSILGTANIYFNRIKKILKVVLSSTVVILGRFICHFLSGIIVWGVYAPPGQPVVLYSLIYNGSYMLGELIITVVAITTIMRIMSRRYEQK